MKTQIRSSGVFKVLILTVLLSKFVSSQNDQQQAARTSNNLFSAILKLLNDPSTQGGIRIQRMLSTAQTASESDDQIAEASTIDLSNQVYRYPVVKINDANYAQFASQHEWIYVKFFTDWCPHSRKIIPTWHEVSYRLSSTPIAVAEIECEVDDTKLCEKFKVVAYPSFKLLRRGEIRQTLIGEIKDADRLVNEAYKVYLKESRSG